MRSSLSGVRYGLVLVLLSLAALASSLPAAGQGTAASIVGQVTDQSGAVLPGVTVTVTSPALQVPQVTDVTNELGEYRLAPLPIGVYEIVFELGGFSTARRQDVRLTVGFTAKIDVALGLATVAETVTVSGASPVVDVASTAPSTLLTKEHLEATPTGRNGLITLMSLTPGVRSWLEIGGNSTAENPGARVFGQGGEMWLTIEGIATAQVGGLGGGNFWDYQTVEEAQVETLGTSAEAATRGLQVHAIVKSGGNDFHGSGTWVYSGHKLESDNVDAALKALNISTGDALDNQYDQSWDLGGRIIRNRLWFYGAARRLGYDRSVLNAFQPDGSPAFRILKQQFWTGKLSFQATPSNRFIGYVGFMRKHEEEDTSELIAYETRSQPYIKSTFPKVEWQGVRGNSLVASLQVGARRGRSRKDFGTNGLVGRSDIGTQLVWGEASSSGQKYGEQRYHITGAVTWYKPDLFYGNHKFNAGFDFIPDYAQRATLRRPVNYHLVYNNGAPLELVALTAPVVPPVRLNYTGLYVSDSWTIARRLTLDAGLRFANSNGYVPAQCREASDPPSQLAFPAKCFPHVQLPIWRSVAPRLHAAYDLSGDGKTVIKGGWGRYDHHRLLPDILRANENSLATAVYRWNDLNGNNDYDAGEVNLDPNGPHFLRFTGPPTTTPEAGSNSSNPPSSVVNPDLQQPKSDELSISFERELISNFAVRVTGVYSRYKDLYRLQNNLRPYAAFNIPVTRQDPGPDGRLGTADDGGSVTRYEYPPALAGAQFEKFMPVTDQKATQTYRSVELAAFKRLANRWQFMASYSVTKKNNPLMFGLTPTAFGTAVQAANSTPNDEINRADRTWDSLGKISAGYTFRFDVLVSANFQYQSGDPFARQVLFTGGGTIPRIVLNVEPIGTRRLPDINLLGVRVQKSFRLLNAHQVAVRFDVFNALNANTATSVQNRSGAEFLRPRAIMPPRLAEVSVGYRF